METERQKALYQKQKRDLQRDFQNKNNNLTEPFMKKSCDSLYKILQQTPATQKDQILHDQSIADTPILDKLIGDRKVTSDNAYQRDLTQIFQEAGSFSKIDDIYKRSVYNQQGKMLIKPATPTYHAQSSLNFLKNRKKQILMNQATGITLKDLDQIKRKRSKSRQQNSLSKQSSSQQIHEVKYNKINSKKSTLSDKTQRKNQLKRHSKAKSISQLQKIEAVIQQFNTKNSDSKRSFLNRSQVSNKSRQKIRSCSLANSINSSQISASRSLSSNHESEEISNSRALILNSISSKLSESKMIKNVENIKKKSYKSQMIAPSDILKQRLNCLQEFLKEIQIKSRKIKVSPSKTLRKVNNFQIINKIKTQIDSLNLQLNDLSARKMDQHKIASIGKTELLKSHFEQVNFKKYVPDKSQEQMNRIKLVSNMSLSRNNLHLNTSASINIRQNSQQSHRHHKQQSPLKIKFNYKNPQTVSPVVQNTFSYNKNNVYAPQNVTNYPVYSQYQTNYRDINQNYQPFQKEINQGRESSKNHLHIPQSFYSNNLQVRSHQRSCTNYVVQPRKSSQQKYFRTNFGPVHQKRYFY